MLSQTNQGKVTTTATNRCTILMARQKTLCTIILMTVDNVGFICANKTSARQQKWGFIIPVAAL